ACARRLQQLCRQSPILAEIRRLRERLVEQIARMASPQCDVARAIEALQQVVDDARVVIDAALLTALRKNLFELKDRWTLGEHLVVDAPQKRFVDQLGRP